MQILVYNTCRYFNLVLKTCMIETVSQPAAKICGASAPAALGSYTYSPFYGKHVTKYMHFSVCVCVCVCVMKIIRV